ncbi:MAG: class I SAM-dependent methyltransferase [Gammaproteobacteria bacterium]|nr:class I SAM-dependent methyltransferase [Gammaproteobacteria bacterium]
MHQLIETSEELSKVAFGFMASKALFGGLHMDVFSAMADGPKTAEELSTLTHVPTNRISTLMTALASIGIVGRDDTRYFNSPAAESFLVRGAKYEFGDYLRYQIDQQMYPFLQQLNAVLDGSLEEDAVDSYAHWMSDSKQAMLYSEAQHAGSLGPGRSLARFVDLSKAKQLLDVGGGTGAMTISLCNAYPDLNATIIDFPNVAEIGWKFISDAGMVNRVRYVPSNALECEWPTGQCAVLMSYLFSGVPGTEVPGLLRAAHDSLSPGGTLMIHDFMVDHDRRGPELAALWQLQHMAFTPDARSLTVEWLSTELAEARYASTEVMEMIPGMTKLVVARKKSH